MGLLSRLVGRRHTAVVQRTVMYIPLRTQGNDIIQYH